MKRILFVDDEPLVLQGLQRMLRPMRQEWEMEFVDGGAKALALMEGNDFDVVVSDMRMPGMNGAELLGRVMQQHPKTVRIVLSGHADKELILKCVGSTHQFLSKPCDPEALKSTMRRASAAATAFQSEILKSLVGQMNRLPSIPSLYNEIIEALQDPEVPLDIVGEIIGKDMAMTAQILKLVNSAFFGLRRQISSSAEAATYLGLDTLRALVLSINVFSQYESIQVAGFSFSSLWAHSLDTARAAKRVALAASGDRKMADEAFVSGLLHDAGKLVLVANFAEQYAEVLGLVRTAGLDQCSAEQRIFGVNHADVGGYLLGLWGLPVPVVEAIAFHHRPGDAGEKEIGPLAAVHIGNAFAHDLASDGSASLETWLDVNYLTALGVVERLPAWREDFERETTIPQAA